MPNVEKGLKVCSEVGLHGCKRCPFRGSQYCTSLLAQGALTMIKGLKDDYAELDGKRPVVNDELDTLIKETVNTLNAGDATCKVEMTKSDAEKLVSFLSTSLSVSKRVPSFNSPWGFTDVERLERAIRASFEVLGTADPDLTGNDWCQCILCSTKRELHNAYYAFVDAHGEEAARAELHRVIRMRDRENGAESRPTVEPFPFSAYPFSTDDVVATDSDSEEPQSNTEQDVESHDEQNNTGPEQYIEAPRNNSGLRRLQRLIRRDLAAQRAIYDEWAQRSDR